MTKATADAIIDEKQRESLYEIRAGLMDLQEKVLEDQQSRMELLAQLEAITKERDSLKEKKSRLNEYELFAVGPGRHVYRAKANEGALEHFACPNCIISAGNPSVLQVERGYGNDGNESRYCVRYAHFEFSFDMLYLPAPLRS